MKILSYILLLITVIVFGVVFYNKFTDDGLFMALFGALIAAGVPAIFTFVFFQIGHAPEGETPKDPET